jgi:hypothetical protein
MPQDLEPAELVGRTAAQELLAQDLDNVPPAIGRPESIPPPSRARNRVVALGATMTGVTLVLGILLVVVGGIETLSNGSALAIIALALGLVFVGTHWGWVHVAEITGNGIERRHNGALLDRRTLWLERIEPYTRYGITTTVDDDGAITIIRTVYRPVPTGDSEFTFVRKVEREEVHSGDEPSAAVAERAELLRREAAADTERERARYEIAHDAYETALLDRDDEDQQRAARRAASQALSEQINSNLRDPPLVE